VRVVVPGEAEARDGFLIYLVEGRVVALAEVASGGQPVPGVLVGGEQTLQIDLAVGDGSFLRRLRERGLGAIGRERQNRGGEDEGAPNPDAKRQVAIRFSVHAIHSDGTHGDGMP
jgi:hypothetical protein